MQLPPAPIPPVRPLPPSPVVQGQQIIVREAIGPNSLVHLIDMLRQNLDYRQCKKAIRAGLKPATKFLAKRLKEELPKSKRSKNVFRPSGSTAKSVRAVLGAPPGRSGIGKQPIGRVVLVPPHGYVYNFFKGTGPRHAAVISHARNKGLWKGFRRGVGGWGLGASRGSMPKIFDIDQFMERHRDEAITIMIQTFQEMVNAYDFGRPPKNIAEIQDGRPL